MQSVNEAAKIQSKNTLIDLPSSQAQAEMTSDEWRSWFEDEFKAVVANKEKSVELYEK